ncbi:hypothetical protein V493_02742 [Pseudogymnoascus sp. VKM F-4281 (FW-2241)]|nr:hypothetical protein V493_02742 [Pseudogymnoascus sp. VKM F-4281 (FW-2241)]
MSRWQDSITLEVQGPHKEDEDNHKEALISQLQNAQKDIKSLKIEDDTPSDTEWKLISDHFTDIQNLYLEAGFNEELNDKLIPTSWPIERLLISSSCGEKICSPIVLEGRVKHLILLLTSEVRFEGPTTSELTRANSEAIERGEAEAKYITVREGTPEERKIKIVSVSALASTWLHDKYTNPDRSSDPEIPVPEHVNTEILEVLENDALDTFTRMTLALPFIIENLKTLNLRSSNGYDFYLSTEMIQSILPQLTELKTFVFTVGGTSMEDDFLPLIYQQFPPNISTLRFRGPVSLAKSEHWNKWVEAFANPEYLPNLTKLSFVLDLAYEDGKRGSKRRPKEEELREAKKACTQLFAGLASRGIVIETFRDKWADESKSFDQVDERWERMGNGE